MIQSKIKKILSFNGISLIVGILGGLSCFFSLLITKWDATISLKWFVFTIYISFVIILFMIKLVADMNEELKIVHPNTSNAVRYIPESETLLITKNNFLGYMACVSIFYYDESLEVEIGRGYVKNIQDKFLQVQLLNVSNDFQTNYENILQRIESNDVTILQKIIVKSYITYTVN